MNLRIGQTFNFFLELADEFSDSNELILDVADFFEHSLLVLFQAPDLLSLPRL